MSFEAQCHCGAVAVSVETQLSAKAIECNCSHCRIKGLILAAVPGDSVTVRRGEEKLVTYQFNRKIIDHRSCSVCGVQLYARGRGRDGKPMAMINLRCVPGIDLEKLEIVQFDGASL